MPRDHFAKTMFSPYFQSDHYKDTATGQKEEQFYQSLRKIKQFFKLKKKSNKGE